ncbi:MAG: AAA family ATPase [Bacteroidales bacterium]|nr:AAA family ATPase [Bacteroidales bacterium]
MTPSPDALGYSRLMRRMLQHLPFTPSAGQREVRDKLLHFAFDVDGAPLMLLNGFAGTGKTSVMAAFARLLQDLHRPVVLLAPTGRAAKVLSSHVGSAAGTIHRQIYRRKSSTDAFSSFELNFNKLCDAIFIVDEASMIGGYAAEQTFFGSGNLLADLVEYVGSRRDCRLLLAGDTAQLPPVGLSASPALVPSCMEQYIRPIVSSQLTEVARQAEGSGILANATMLRTLIDMEVPVVPTFQTEAYTDITPISGGELLERLEDAYDRVGQEETIVVCYSNKRANRYNEGIRSRILFREETISPGDVLMVVKNNYFWSTGEQDDGFIANGDIVRVRRIRRFTERYGFHFAEADIILTDYDRELDAMLLLDVLPSEQAALPKETQKKLYDAVAEDYAGLSRARLREAMAKDPFYNALQVKYAYAVTGHKSQGGQWHTVFVDNGWFRDEPPDTSYLRWLYTALTRATDRVFLVNFPQKFLTVD